MVFYRKYRPQRFSELVGLPAVRKGLRTAIAKGEPAHAYLFHGPKGTGKTTVARIVAKAVNCQNLQEGEPCGECEACEAIQEGRFLDLIEIDAASNRGIDDVRALRENVKLAPTQGKKKVYVIDEVHMLTHPAFNALLKTLEEPPAHVIFVLCTTEPRKVPETIRSRCSIFEFPRAREVQIMEKLQRICKAEKADIKEEDLGEIAHAAQGGFRDAETILEQVIVGGESIEELLGVARSGDIYQFVDWLSQGKREEALTFINHLFSQGENLEVFSQGLLDYLRRLMLIQAGVGEELVEAPREQFEAMEKQAHNLSEERLSKLIHEFTQARESIKYAPIPQLPLELAVLEVTK